MKIFLMKETLRSVPAQETLGTVSDIHDIFSNLNLPFTHGTAKGNINRLYVMGVSWSAATNNSFPLMTSMLITRRKKKE